MSYRFYPMPHNLRYKISRKNFKTTTLHIFAVALSDLSTPLIPRQRGKQTGTQAKAFKLGQVFWHNQIHTFLKKIAY